MYKTFPNIADEIIESFNLKFKGELMLLNFYDHLYKSPQTRVLVEHEKNEATHLGLIHEFLSEKYNLEQSELNPYDLRMKHQEVRLEKIKGKVMHGLLFQDDEDVIDRANSSMWLSKGNITPQQEGMLCKLQDRNLYFGGSSVKCPHCGRATKSVQHLATKCGGMLEYDYKKRHNEVVRCLHFQFTKKYGCNKNKKLKMYWLMNARRSSPS